MDHDALKSALIKSARESTISNISSWWNLAKEKFMSNYKCSIKIVPLHELSNWSFSDSMLIHNSGRFFSIVPMQFRRKRIDESFFKEWGQPMILQPEIGFLGFLTFIIDGKLMFLAQWKIEPGNEGFLQISPTIQATKSNFEKVHGGKTPEFLNVFMNGEKVISVMYDQIQSEQGSRFFKKRNRNVILLADIDLLKDVKLNDKFYLLSLKDLKNLMQLDNVVNMDTRTVLSNLITILS